MKTFYTPGKTRRFGFMLRHRALWLSELLATVMVALLLVCYMSVTLIILLNYVTVRGFDHAIAAQKTECTHLSYTLDNLRREARALDVMRRLACQKVADSTLCQVASLVRRSSDQFGYDPLLLVAVIRVEGEFNPAALGRFRSGALSGALGLMQLNFKTAREVALQLEMPHLEEKDLFNPAINMVLGVAYLTQLINRFQSFKLGLLAYNQGPGTVLGQLVNKESLSVTYYKKVLSSYFQLKRMANEMEPITQSGVKTSVP
jgi:soluble lytic murein transglycosylase-like protein